MTETQKPFACSIKGCDMTFTNEDHLNWHQKKHDMMLNLGLASKNNEVADQTPTPTRFIRNCEEVGLFQDLQNVNPFDEFFKKAVEAAKSGNTLEVPQSQTNSDDTLHTPHILPHIEESHKKITTSTNDNSHSNDFLNNVIALSNTSEISEVTESPVFIISNTEVNNGIKITENGTEVPNIKLKIKKALQSKDKQKTPPDTAVSLVPVRALMEQKQVMLTTKTKNDVINTLRKENNKDKCYNFTSISLEKIREVNRAAQFRCRKRKKEALKNMEEELFALREEVKRLRTENVWLKAQLLGYADKNDEVVEDGITDDPLPVIKKQLAKGNKKGVKASRVIMPSPTPSVPKVAIPRNNVTTSSLIQLVQVVPAVTFPVTTSPIADVSKFSLRKIVPKIVINK